MTAGRVGGALTAAGLGALAGRYAVARSQADRSLARQVEHRLGDIGEVDDLTVLPLVERLTIGTPGGPLRGEAGLSYLVRVGSTTLVFDTGLNAENTDRPALVTNAEALGVDLQAIDGLVLSHRHVDHVGGLGMMRRRTFGFSPEPLEPRGLPAYVPTAELRHDRVEVRPTSAPVVIAPGVAVMPPLPRALFVLGPVVEQAMVVNVRGFGLVVLTGCGHPPMEAILGVTEQVLDVPIKGVVGGFHLPVHPWNTPLIPQAVLGNPHWPWQPIGERDAQEVIEQIRARGPYVVALSGHDSTAWTFDAFQDAFGDRFHPLRVGGELRISARDAGRTPLAAGVRSA